MDRETIKNWIESFESMTLEDRLELRRQAGRGEEEAVQKWVVFAIWEQARRNPEVTAGNKSLIDLICDFCVNVEFKIEVKNG